jgi:23S rRNA (cytosine1962-C5)-methyltransferase
MNYPILTLKSGRERSANNFHPWIFSGAVKQFPASPDGSIIQVQTNKGETLGLGFYSPQSQIVCRLFHFGKAIEIDESYWRSKLLAALHYRQSLPSFNLEHTNAFRLLHAEGDFIPGIIADVYHNTVVVQVLIKGIEPLFPLFVKLFREMGFPHIYIKTKDSSKRFENIQLPAGWVDASAAEMPLIVRENGLEFQVDVETGQKTGFFLDQRDNRELLRSLSQGKKVLNAFSYTGGFSVYALAGGASEVVSVDISKDAVARADENVRLNAHLKGKHSSIATDCFDYLKTADEDFDIIVLDPPAFAKHARAVDNACRGYKELNMAALRKIKSGGLMMTYSCSQNISPDLFRKVIFGAAADVGRNVRIVRQLSQADCHPINIYHPEGEYLKGLLLYID